MEDFAGSMKNEESSTQLNMLADELCKEYIAQFLYAKTTDRRKKFPKFSLETF